MQIGDLSLPQLPPFARTDRERLAGVERAAARGDAEETARQFETLLGTLLVRELRRSMPKGMFGDGPGAEVYEGWFDEQLGTALGQRDALGIAELVRSTLVRAQAARDGAAR
jgi:Rod binding domain-containing protein